MAAWLWLKAVPWSTLLANAPALVDSARKLIERRNTQASAGALDTSDPSAVAGRIQALERRQQQLAELLESLAESNEKLVAAVAALRARAVWTGRIMLALAIAVALLAARLLLQ